MKILFPPTINQAVSVIRHGGILIYPTDTLYGIGGDATNQNVVEKIYRVKERDSNKSLSIILPSIAAIKKYCEVSRQQEKILKKYLPGPYTFILKLRKNLPVTTNGKVGVRIPDYPSLLRICRLVDTPLITTSANLSGESDAQKLGEVNTTLLHKVDFAIDGGKTKYSMGSTVVDMVDNRVLRKGAGKYI